MKNCRLALSVSLAVLAVLLAFTAAEAAASSYRPGAEIVSASLERLEQGDDESTVAVISGGGRYVGFQSKARNFFAADDPDPSGHYRVGGIFRRDLLSGALELVADGDLISSSTGSRVTRGAQNPSISADGRYVAFSTAQQLVPEDLNPNVDVYVRDMTVPIRSPGAYDLVSARDGGTVPASYASTRFGSEITHTRAISADGQRVVFKTTNSSDLPSGSGPTATPSQQIFVRDRAARSTTLVTLTNEPPAGQTELAPAGGADSSAVISADGTTVVWAGRNANADPGNNIPAQTRFLNGEIVDPAQDRARAYYLWRRIADGPAAVTRRITGAVDLDDPACPADGTVFRGDPVVTGPCYGPLALSEDWNSDLPQEPPALSADGYKVAFLVNPPLRPNNESGNAPDLFFTDMTPGLSRKASTVELTREIVQDPAAGSFIKGLAMTADGRRIVFQTVRTAFVLPTPRLVDPPASPDVPEVYALDLVAMEIERVTRPDPVFEALNPVLWNGGEVNGDPAEVRGLSISADGERIAFASKASNLFVGDSNDKPDIFVAKRAAPGSQGGQEPVAELPFDLPAQTADRRRAVARIAVRVKSARRGSVSLAVRVTDAGLVEARTLSRVRSSRKGSGNRKGPLRTLARVRKQAIRAGEVTLVLRTSNRYRTLLPKRGRLTARLLVSFTPAGGGRKVTARRNVALRPEGGRK